MGDENSADRQSHVRSPRTALEKSGHPVRVVCAAVDDELNDQGIIVPGLGDAGDRMYGTK